MSNVFFILLLAVGFAGWKVLDHFQLPNTFSILLLILTVLSGILWCYHRFAVMPRRRRQIARAEQRSGKALTDEEKAKIEPISEGSAPMPVSPNRSMTLPYYSLDPHKSYFSRFLPHVYD